MGCTGEAAIEEAALKAFGDIAAENPAWISPS
jgi:hypothetical protein